MITKKITIKLVFATAQSLMSFSAIVLALVLELDLLNVQSSINVSGEALNFYVLFLLIAGLVLLVGGIFLIYDWWESRK